MHAVRKQILQILKETEGSTVAELAARLGMAPVSVRHHLDILQGDNLICIARVQRKGCVGRPQQVYVLTPEAGHYFPNNFAALAGNLAGENPPIGGVPSASGSPNLEQAGRQIIAKANPTCTTCHGEDLTGGVGPSLHGIADGPKSENLQQLAADHPEDWPVFWIDGTGPEVADLDRGGMPAFGDQLSHDEIVTLVEYLKTLE